MTSKTFKIYFLKNLLFFLALFSNKNSISQSHCSFSSEDLNIYYCINSYSKYEDNINASLVLDNILNKIGLKNHFFIVKTCKGINNAIATNYQGIAYILLDVEWMENLKYGKNDWFHLAVISHEIAHHLLGHTVQNSTSLKDQRNRELESDEFSGYVLGLYGASTKDIENLLVNFPSNDNLNSTHPQKQERLVAIKKGYQNSLNDKENILLQKITENIKFDLKDVPNLVSAARNSYYLYLKTGNYNYYVKSIDNYQQALRFADAVDILHDLANLFLVERNFTKYVATLELVYEKTKDVSYLVEMISSLINSDRNAKETLYAIDKYKNLLYKIKTSDLIIPIQYIHLANFYTHLGMLNYYTNEYQSYLNIAEEILKKGLSLLELKNTKDIDYFNDLSNFYNLLGLNSLWRNNYNESLESFYLSKKSFEKAEMFSASEFFENFINFYSHNHLTIMYNIALSLVRLEKWESALEAILEYEDYYNKLSPQKKNSFYSPDGDESIFYLKGRCYHGLKDFYTAIFFYNKAIEKNNNSIKYILYFRGLSYIGLNDQTKACEDLEDACELGSEISCTRFSLICN